MLGKAVPSIDDSLGEEATPGVQTTPSFGDLDCVSSCTCNIAEHEHAVEAYSGLPFVHSEDFHRSERLCLSSKDHKLSDCNLSVRGNVLRPGNILVKRCWTQYSNSLFFL